MASSRHVQSLKFTGTVTLGLLTGTSYALSSIAVPVLLNLPTASSANHALSSLVRSSQPFLDGLSGASSVVFLTAYVISPRYARHPYLLYAGALSAASLFAGHLAPLVPEGAFKFLRCRGSSPSSTSSSRSAAALDPSREHPAAAGSASASSSRSSSRRGLEQSFEVLGDSTMEGSVSGGEDDTATPSASTVLLPNGEEVHAGYVAYQRHTAVRAAVAGLGFLLAVVGIWGDAAPYAVSRTYVYEL